jgi:carbon-monoxide dehydrogenase large subunit
MDSGIGAPVRRAEDLRLLTGRGRYSDDKNQPGQAYAHVLRSPHAHAAINAIDTGDAKNMPGVLAVLTADDYESDGLKPIPHGANNQDAVNPKIRAFLEEEGALIFDVAQPPLASDKVRFGGEGVALVVAESLAQARDAAEHIEVDYDPLPAYGHVMDAMAPGAERIWDSAPGNICLDAVKGDQEAAEAAFAAAAHVVEMELPVTRVANCQMEPRAAVAWHDAGTDRTTLYTGSQGANRLKMHLAPALDVAPELVRVITEDVGGGYGPRNALYPEFVLISWAAKRLGRPVKWTSERTEAFVADYQGRDLLTQASLALDSGGKFLAMRTRMIGAVGGHTVAYVSLNNGHRLTTSLYDIPAAHAHIQGVLTNTPSTSPYRGAGRPEAMFVIERLIDRAAELFGFDRIELRRKNLIAQDGFPYRNAMGLTYDCGAFETNMNSTIKLAGWDGVEGRRAEARERGRLLGIGLANYIEAPVGAPIERAEIAIQPDGRVAVIIGTQSQGQGHETSFRQVIVDWLGVPFDAIDIITGDTDVVKAGGGTHSDRSIRMAGNVMVKASEKIIEIGRDAASHLLEAAREDIAFAEGRFTVTGTDREIGIFEVAAAMEAGDVPDAPEGGMAADDEFWGRLPAFPNGCVVCEVEVDPETGTVEITRYSTVDDVGRVVNPMIVHGQTHGGIAMGVGQALLENAWYDPDSAQLLAGSFMDYCVARADDLPSFNVELNEDVPSAGNPLGVKGGGEGGTTPALAVVISAITDALKEVGVTHVDLPASPERVWQAIQRARSSATPRPARR